MKTSNQEHKCFVLTRRLCSPRVFDEGDKRRRGQRGLQKAPVKKAITLPYILVRCKATGRGWQSRMNEALRRSIERA